MTKRKFLKASDVNDNDCLQKGKKSRIRGKFSDHQEGSDLTASSRTVRDFIKEYSYDDEVATGLLQLIAEATEDDPPLFFGWKNVNGFLASIAGVNNAAPPFPLPVPLTEDGFKSALLHHVRAGGAAAPQYNCVLPCSLVQSFVVVQKLGFLCFDNWFQRVAALQGHNMQPIAEIVVPRPRTPYVDKAVFSAPNLPQLWG
jgi:hypothetical protein